MPRPEHNNCKYCGGKTAPDRALVFFVSQKCLSCGQIVSQYMEPLHKLGISKETREEIEQALFEIAGVKNPPERPLKKPEPEAERVPRRKSR